MCSVGERRLDFGTRLQGAQHGDRGDRCERQFGRNVVSNTNEAQDVDMQQLATRPCRLKLGATIVSEPEFKRLAAHGLTDNVGVAIELVADGSPDEVGPVRIETVLHHKVDLTKINEAEIDRDLFSVSGPTAKLRNVSWHVVRSECRETPAGSRFRDESRGAGSSAMSVFTRLKVLVSC